MLLPSPLYLRYLPRAMFYIAVLYGITWVTRYPESLDEDEFGELLRNPSIYPPPEKLVFSIRTPGTDVYYHLPTVLLLTDPMFHENTLLFSDIEMDIGRFHVIDLLDKTDESYAAQNPDFERYRAQLMYTDFGVKLEDIKSGDEATEFKIKTQLDKYKYLRMLERTWAIRPERMWYIFMEADAYIVRANLIRFLSQYDSETLHFFGNNPHPDAPNPFGHGGSTFILSAAAMRRLFGKNKSKDADRDAENDALLNSWIDRMQASNLGHDILTNFLQSELSLTINTTFPHLSGFSPTTVPYGPGQWCESVIGLSGLRPEDQSDMWRFERDRIEKENITSSLTFAELYNAFVRPQPLALPEEDWDNLSSDESNAAWNIALTETALAKENVKSHIHEHVHHPHGPRQDPISTPQTSLPSSDFDTSFEACREACNQNEACMQYSYSSVPAPNWNDNGETKCHLSSRLRFGVHRFAQEFDGRDGVRVRRSWRSGWRKDRLEHWAEGQRCNIRRKSRDE